MHLKRILSLLLTAVLVIGLTACASSGDGNGSGTGQGTDSGDSTPVGDAAGGSDTLSIAVAADLTSLDPQVGKEVQAVIVSCNIFGTLLRLDENGDVQPYIAESWEQIDDVTFEFKIREGITFHDGSPLTGEDVQYSLTRAIESSYVSYIINYVDTVELVDDYTVRINLHDPYVGSLINLTVPYTGIVPKALVEANPDGFFEHPIGSGPYEFVEWSQGNQVKLKAYDDYFEGKAKTENVVFRIIPEGTQRTIALENGEVDIVYDVPVNDLSIISGNDSLTLHQSPSLQAYYISLNCQKEELSDIRVRQAIRHAIDSQTIIDSVLYGAAEPANTLVAPAVKYAVTDADYFPYDVEKAKELLAEAGYPDGIDLSLAVGEDATRVAVCQVLQEQLKQAGINVTIDIYDQSTYYDHANKSELELAMLFWICSAGHADYTQYSVLHSSQFGGGGNRAFYANDRVDELLQKARSTMDETEIMAAYREMEEILYEESPNVTLYYTTLNVATGSYVQSFVMDPAGYHKLENVVVAK